MKKLLFWVFSLAIVALLQAQTTITIGQGTGGGRYPFNDYATYSRSQCIYLETEIGTPGTIHRLRWFRSDSGANPQAIGYTQIWLKPVPYYVFSDNAWEEPGSLVFAAANLDLGSGGGWYELDIDDFEYLGGNLMVSVYTQNAPFSLPHAVWRYSDTKSLKRCKLGNSNSQNPPALALSSDRPNLQIELSASAPISIPDAAILEAPLVGHWRVAGDLLSWGKGLGFPAAYDVYLDLQNPPQNLVSQGQTELSYTLTSLLEAHTYYWQVLPQNSVGAAENCPVWSFKTPAADNLNSSFEAVFPPSGWDNPGAWEQSSTHSKHGSFSVRKFATNSQKYLLSTPILQVKEDDILSFWSLCSKNNGELELLYSQDRSNWQLLDTIRYDSANLWYNHHYDLSFLAGADYYFAFRSGLMSANFYIDTVIGPHYASLAPGPVALLAPADLAQNQSQNPEFSWKYPTDGGIAQSYRVYLDTQNPPQRMVYDGSDTFCTADISLAYDTLYYWTVEAYNSFGTSARAETRQFKVRNNPLKPLPYFQDFDAAPTLLSIEWEGEMLIKANHGTNDGKGLCRNLYRNAPNAAAYSPQIGALWGSNYVVFDYRYVDYLQYPRQETVLQPGDILELQISFNGGEYRTIYTIDHSNHISSMDFATVAVPFNSMDGDVLRLRFWANWGAGDYYLDIDNVLVRQVPQPLSLPLGDYSESSETWAHIFNNQMLSGVADASYLEGKHWLGRLNLPYRASLNLEVQDKPGFSNQNMAVFLLDSVPQTEHPAHVLAQVYNSYPLQIMDIELNAGDYYILISNAPAPADFHFKLNVDYTPHFDFPEGVAVLVGEGENAFYLTMGGGPANRVENGQIPALGNHHFSPSASIVLALIGSNPWSITLDTSAPWAAYYREGEWHAKENIQGRIVFFLAAAKSDLIIPLLLGDRDPSLPVQLSSFTVLLNAQNQADISWKTETESGLLGYSLIRNSIAELVSGTQICALIPAANSSQSQSYHYIDKELAVFGSYYYWLQVSDMNGATSYLGPICLLYEMAEAHSPELPLLTGLKSIYPNPFNPDTSISFSLSEAQEMELAIYNARGQLLRSLEKGYKSPGHYRVIWNAKDNAGQELSSGLYFVRLHTKERVFVKKLVLMK